MDIERIGRAASGGVNAVEELSEADEVGIVFKRAGPPAAIGIGAIGRAADRRKGDPIASESDAVLGIAGVLWFVFIPQQTPALSP